MEAFFPLYDRVLMEFLTEEKTDGGLFVPKSAQEKEASKVKVVAVGPGKYDVERREHLPLNVKVGDVVYVNPYLGMRVKMVRGAPQLLIQKEEEILGRITAGSKEEAGGG